MGIRKRRKEPKSIQKMSRRGEKRERERNRKHMVRWQKYIQGRRAKIES